MLQKRTGQPPAPEGAAGSRSFSTSVTHWPRSASRTASPPQHWGKKPASRQHSRPSWPPRSNSFASFTPGPSHRQLLGCDLTSPCLCSLPAPSRELLKRKSPLEAQARQPGHATIKQIAVPGQIRMQES